MFFDEADALFGKRSEVKDDHYRYAGIEISYLLQKIVEHQGVAILATNLRDNLDVAFIRRLTLCSRCDEVRHSAADLQTRATR